MRPPLTGVLFGGNRTRNKGRDASVKALVFALTFVLLTIEIPATAATVIYDGSVQGQLDVFDSPVTLTLVPGVNLVRGSSFMIATQIGGGYGSGEGFGFVIQGGYVVTNISYAYSNVVVSPNVASAGVLLQIAPTGADGTFDKTQSLAHWTNYGHFYSDGSNSNSPLVPSPMNYPFVPDGGSPPSDFLPVGAGLYWLIVGKELGNFGDATWDYELALTVEPVPPPISPANMLATLLANVISAPPGKSLADKVKLAQTYYSVPDIQATCAVMTDFVNEVKAQAGKKKLTAAQATTFTSEAQAIMAAIGCN